MNVTIRSQASCVTAFVLATWAFSVCQAQTPAGGAASGGVVTIPKDTSVIVSIDRDLSSYGASPGEKIKFTVIQDVIVGGFVIAKTGDRVIGAVQEAVRGSSGMFAGPHPRGGDLRISIDTLHSYCGATVELDFDHSEYRNPTSINMGFLSKHDVTIQKGQKYEARVSYPQRVCGEQGAASSAPTSSDVIRSTPSVLPTASPSS